MRFATPLLLLAPALSIGCSDDDSTPPGDNPDGGMGGAMMATGGVGGGSGSGGSAGGGMAGSGGGMQVSFATDIHPFLLQKCAGAGCHSVASFVTPAHANEDVDVAYAATQDTSFNGGFVYERMLARTSGMDPLAFGLMPPDFADPPCEGPPGSDGCLTVDEFELLQAWVDQGALP